MIFKALMKPHQNVSCLISKEIPSDSLTKLMYSTIHPSKSTLVLISSQRFFNNMPPWLSKACLPKWGFSENGSVFFSNDNIVVHQNLIRKHPYWAGHCFHCCCWTITVIVRAGGGMVSGEFVCVNRAGASFRWIPSSSPGRKPFPCITLPLPPN